VVEGREHKLNQCIQTLAYIHNRQAYTVPAVP